MSRKSAGGKPSNGPSSKKQITNLQSPELAPYWLSALIESADDAIISKTLDGIITSWNKGAERIFGYTAEEVIGKPVTILIPKEYEHEEPAILTRLRAGDRIEHYETVRVRKDGTRIDISLTVSPIRGPKDEIIGASKIARDITEQRQSRIALDDASQRLKLALAASRLGDWSWDAKTDVITMSPTAARIFGITARPIHDLVRIAKTASRGRSGRQPGQRSRKLLLSKADYDIEYRVKRNGDSEVWVSAKGRGVYDKSGTVVGMLGFVQDITSRKATEETLREQADALRTLNEVGQIISAELDLHNTVQAVTDAATNIDRRTLRLLFLQRPERRRRVVHALHAGGCAARSVRAFSNAESNRFVWSNFSRRRSRSN